MLASRHAVARTASPRVLLGPHSLNSLYRLYSADATSSEPSSKTTKPSTTTAFSSSQYKSRTFAAPASSSARSASTAAAPAVESPAVSRPKMVAPLKDDKSIIEPLGPTAARIDWTAGFHGISEKPVTQEQFQVLIAPLDIKDIEVKPDGVIYLPEIKYRRKMNEAFGPMGWGMIPRGEAIVGTAIVTREYALIVDGRFVSQAQGENSFFSPDQLPSAVEGCKSNALMRCSKDLGIASELWDPQFVRWFKKTHMEEVWVEHTTTKKKRTFWYRKGQVEVAYPYKLSK